MLRNYLKTAFRNLMRQRSSAFFNIGGLTLAISSSIVLFLLISHVFSYDKFHTNYSRIYRVVTQSEGNEETFYTPGVPTPLSRAFRNDFPEVEHVVFTRYDGGGLVTIPQHDGVPKKFNEDEGIVFTEPGYFQTFDRALLSGDAIKGLDEPNEAVVSRELANKYFGSEDVVGEVLNYQDVDYKISAVVENSPGNTDFPFTLFLSFETIRKKYEERGWGGISSNDQCYFLLKDGVDISQVENRMQAFTDKYVGEKNYEKELFNIQPVSEMHFNDRYYTYSGKEMNRSSIMAIFFIGLFLIITGCINFINLSTAEAIKRSKEVGIRKSLGSTRGQLMFQFLGETSLVTFISIILSIGIAQLGLSYLNTFMDLELSINLLRDQSLVLFLLVLFVLVSVMAGIYPAFILSGYTPAMVMKNDSANKSSFGHFMRKGLVVFQFSISQLLIIGTIVIINQTNLFRSQDLGFRKDAIIMLPLPEQELPTPDSAGHSSTMRTLKNEVSRLAGVELVSLCNSAPSSGNVAGTGFLLEGWSDEQRKDTQVKTVDGNYIDLFELKLLSGDRLADLDTATGYVVNREFARMAGFTDPSELVGKRVRIWRKLYPVVGVVEDFNTTSLHDKIEPTVLLNRINNYYSMAIRINPKNFQSSIATIQKQWESAYPKHIFTYEFLDENIKEFYEKEEKMSVLLTVFTSISILIGCIGLFGLATFVANQKTKEIGVRKVLGASVSSIVFMFSKEFVILIFIGFVIAAPIAWIAMNNYLSDFDYRIELGPGIFLFGFALTLLIAVFTVGYRSFKAAVINPVKALRYE
ncbi:MAG TPA: ABC transporter permease [Chryseolinea sp.]|nr:ABC transporter permease [Chryseolinea sp.]HPH45387.1 ABC transporter permease [Chryseolinea sp.]HPM29341.1 ABC transporter permease [Chryseolinea sp.]